MMLKEWSTVVGALEAGEQSVLLRKGGIMEAASGFVLQAEKFILYPTWEHQDAESIREPFRYHLERPHPSPGTNSVKSYATVLEQADVISEDVVNDLEPFHIWSKSYVESRRQWQPQRPLKAIYVQVFEMESVSTKEYAGCKSWLDTDMEIAGGTPVLDNEIVQKGLEKFRGIVS